MCIYSCMFLKRERRFEFENLYIFDRYQLLSGMPADLVNYLI